MLNTYSLGNVPIITPQQLLKRGTLIVENDKIAGIGEAEKSDFSFPAGGKYYMYPALINVHDHLRGNYLPKVGPADGTFYLRWSEWDNDLKSAPVYKEREKNSIRDLYTLSAYKNLFSGVVTVNDHFPHEQNAPYIPDLPVRVIQNYTLAHACSSFALNWGDGIEIEHKLAVEKNFPFIIHCEEGFDPETQHGLEHLQELNCLDDHNVLVHCIGFSDEDIKRVKNAGASTVWCPNSNIFMFNVTCKIKKIIKAGINVCLGTDATHSGGVNLLSEIRFARQIYQKMYSRKLPARTLFNMVTINPARAFKMEERIGTLEPGKLADILVIRSALADPYEAIVNAGMQDIELLLNAGDPILGSPAFEELFRQRGGDFTSVSVARRKMLVKGDPAGLMRRIRQNVGYAKQLDFIPIDEHTLKRS